MSTNLYTRAQRLHRVAHKLPKNQAIQTMRAMLVVIQKEGIVRGIEHFEAVKKEAAMAHTKGESNG